LVHPNHPFFSQRVSLRLAADTAPNLLRSLIAGFGELFSFLVAAVGSPKALGLPFGVLETLNSLRHWGDLARLHAGASEQLFSLLAPFPPPRRFPLASPFHRDVLVCLDLFAELDQKRGDRVIGPNDYNFSVGSFGYGRRHVSLVFPGCSARLADAAGPRLILLLERPLTFFCFVEAVPLWVLLNFLFVHVASFSIRSLSLLSLYGHFLQAPVPFVLLSILSGPFQISPLPL